MIQFGEPMPSGWYTTDTLQNTVRVNLRYPGITSAVPCFLYVEQAPPGTPWAEAWVVAQGITEEWMAIVQDGLNAIAGQYLPASPGLLDETGVFDCKTSVTASAMKAWYRQSMPDMGLDWPEFILAINFSPKLRQMLLESMHRWESGGFPSMPGRKAKWLLPDPNQYIGPGSPSCVGQSFGIVERGPGKSIDIEDVTPLSTPSTNKTETDWAPIGVVALLGTGVILWTLAR